MESNSMRYRCIYLSCEFSLESPFKLGIYELKCRKQRTHCPDSSVSQDETVRSDYDSQLSGIVRTRSDVICQLECFASLAVEVPTTIG